MAIASLAAALGVSVGTLYVAAGIMVVVVNYATGGVVSLTITGMLIAFAQTAIEIRKATVAALTNGLYLLTIREHYTNTAFCRHSKKCRTSVSPVCSW